MKRLLTTLSHKWPEYLLEIMVLIVGIYGAFMLENWNEKRIERNQEQLILQQLRNEYQKNLEQLEDKIQLRNISINKAIKILEMAGSPAQVTFDTLINAMKFLGIMPTFDPISSDIISSGNIRLIQNQQLKESLQAWSSDVIQLQEEEQKNIELQHLHLSPIHGKYGLGWHLLHSLYDNSIESQSLINIVLIDTLKTTEIRIPKPIKVPDAFTILNDDEFTSIVSHLISLNHIANQQSLVLKAKILEILIHIDADLDKN